MVGPEEEKCIPEINAAADEGGNVRRMAVAPAGGAKRHADVAGVLAAETLDNAFDFLEPLLLLRRKDLKGKTAAVLPQNF